MDSFGQSAHYITGFNKKLLEAAVLVTDVTAAGPVPLNPPKVEVHLRKKKRKEKTQRGVKNDKATTSEYPLKVNLIN